MSKKAFPIMVNEDLRHALYRHAEAKVKQFKKDIYPLLLELDLFDDAHIQKYLNCDTKEAIYKDALTENQKYIFRLEQKYNIEQQKKEDEREDVWKFFRSPKSPVKSPNEEGFIFAALPLADSYYKHILEQALSVKKGEILIDTNILDEVSIIKPTDEQKELYNVVSDFCEIMNSKKLYKKYHISGLFFGDASGIHPNIHSILKKQWITEKKHS